MRERQRRPRSAASTAPPHELAQPRDVEADLGPRGGDPKERAEDHEQGVLAHRVAVGRCAPLHLVEGDDAGVVHWDAEVPCRAPDAVLVVNLLDVRALRDLERAGSDVARDLDAERNLCDRGHSGIPRPTLRRTAY